MKSRSISIRNIPEDVYKGLRAMAKRNHRSLQEQVKIILEREIRLSNRSFLAKSNDWRKRLEGRRLSNAVKMIREDRNR